jgi:uncharacterized membrane protein
MSLIDDALKRAHGTESPEDAVKRGASYPFMARNLQDRRRSRRALLTGFLAGGFLAAALAGALVYVLVGWRPAPVGRVLAPARTLPPPAASSPLPQVVVKPPVRPHPTAPGGEEAAAARRAGKQAAPKSSPSRSTISAGQSGDEDAAVAPPAAKTYSKSATLPDGRKLELDGIVFSETNPVAMINGRVVAVGGIIEGLTVAGIEAERVELKGNDLRLFITLK